MSQINTTFSHHLFQVAVAELVGDVPSKAEDDYRRVEVSPFE